MTNAQIIKAFKDLLDYANGYSDAMAKEGRGAEQLGSNVASDSVGGMARAAIKRLEENEEAKVNRGKCQIYGAVAFGVADVKLVSDNGWSRD